MLKTTSAHLTKGLVAILYGSVTMTTWAGVNPSTGLVTMDNPFSTPDYFAVPNFAFSPLPEYCDGNTTTLNCGVNGGIPYIGGGMRKFVNSLPRPSYNCADPGSQNEIGQCLPIATPDITTYPEKPPSGSVTRVTPAADYYSIEVVDYQRQMHSDLPVSGTHLRGYHQLPTAGNPLTPLPTPQYLGPFIIAQKGKPVRLKFTNNKQSDLPLPVDTSYYGSGPISYGGQNRNASQRRSSLHHHGGDSPWVNDGTPHQWITPANDPTVGVLDNPAAGLLGFRKGWGFQNVPDMVTNNAGGVACAATGAPSECVTPASGRNDGVGTFYYPNNLSNRMLWYHDHAFGITRLNVYAGEASGYLLVDNNVEDALGNLGVPGYLHVNPATSLIDPALSDLEHLIPMIIQDKTYVPDNGEEGGQLAAQDPTWNAPNSPNRIGAGWGKGDLWLPHVYMPNQLPFGITDKTTSPPTVLSTAPLGRWDYGPWFAPPILANQPDQSCTTSAFTALGYGAGAFRCPGVPSNNIVASPELFLDTPLINGTPYPKMQVTPSAYRIRILNASNDRYWNLNMFYAVTQAPIVVITDTVGTGAGASATARVNASGQIEGIDLVDPGAAYSATPGAVKVTVLQRPVAGPHSTGKNFPRFGGLGATGTATVDPATGELTGITVDVPGTEYIPSTVCKNIDPNTIDPSLCTEVKLVDAVPHLSSGHPNGALPRTCTGSKTMTIGQSGLATAPVDGSGNLLYGPTGMPDAGPSGCWPNTWPTDGTGRFGGVPDAATAGPALIQIGTEGGLLPKAVPIPATPNGFIYDRRMATVLLVSTHGVWMGPAERADFIVNFTGMADPGKTSVFIFYNDSVAPAPLFDPRYDMFTDAQDMSDTGGAPSTLSGYGPNTRTTMQFVVSGTNDNKPGKPAFSLAQVNAPLLGIPHLFETTQDPIIVPEPSYPTGNGYSATATTGTYNTFTFPNLLTGTINDVTITNGGLYSQAPLVSFVPTDPVGPTITAQATATLPNGGLASIDIVPGQGGAYTSPPNVTLSPQGGATSPTAILADSVVSGFNLINGGTGFMSAPTVWVNGNLAANTTISPVSGSLVSLSLTTGGAGYVSPPSVTVANAGAGGVAATVTANLATTGQIDTVSGVTSSCTGAIGPRAVTFSGGDANATVTANVQMLGTLRITGVTVTNGGTNYPIGTTMTVSGCTVSAATIKVARALSSFTVNAGGSGYAGTPIVTIGGPNALLAGNTKTQATANAVLSTTGTITSVALIPGSIPATIPQTSPLTVTLNGGLGSGAIISANLAAAPVASVTLGTGKGSFASPPTVGFACPNGVACGGGAAATATLQSRGIASIAVTNPGAGYKSVPSVTLTPVTATDPVNGGLNSGVAHANMSPVNVEFKGLVEGFDPIWGTLAIELTSSTPLVPNNVQAIAQMPFGFVDPPVDLLVDNTPSVWRIDHVGVDTHTIHYHLLNAQVLNSVDLAGQIYMPDDNELGWKESIKFSPFQSRFIAMKVNKPIVPWELPTNVRPMDPTVPIGTVSGPAGCVNNPFAVPPQLGPNCVPFATTDPQGNVVTVTNALVNFGYEYVHHCHLLGHEEHDMMRPISFISNPEVAPILGTITVSSATSNGRATLNWTDTTVSETGFIVEQCYGTSAGTAPATCPGTWTTLTTLASNTGPSTGSQKSYQTPALPIGRRYWWRISAVNQVGCLSNACSNPFNGWPSYSAPGPVAAYAPVVH